MAGPLAGIITWLMLRSEGQLYVLTNWVRTNSLAGSSLVLVKSYRLYRLSCSM